MKIVHDFFVKRNLKPPTRWRPLDFARPYMVVTPLITAHVRANNWQRRVMSQLAVHVSQRWTRCCCCC